MSEFLISFPEADRPLSTHGGRSVASRRHSNADLGLDFGLDGTSGDALCLAMA
jgi:hypothetical protein